MLFRAHDNDDIASQFGLPNEEVREKLQRGLTKLKAYRDEHRPRPHLDDKILTCWNGLMVSFLFTPNSCIVFEY